MTDRSRNGSLIDPRRKGKAGPASIRAGAIPVGLKPR